MDLWARELCHRSSRHLTNRTENQRFSYPEGGNLFECKLSTSVKLYNQQHDYMHATAQTYYQLEGSMQNTAPSLNIISTTKLHNEGVSPIFTFLLGSRKGTERLPFPG